jgi:BASS family bile acid:Na+ symporter
VLIFSFFDGLGGMAVVAGVWGFWDIIAGLLLAGWWARRPLDGAAAPRPGTAELSGHALSVRGGFWSRAQRAFWAKG